MVLMPLAIFIFRGWEAPSRLNVPNLFVVARLVAGYFKSESD